MKTIYLYLLPILLVGMVCCKKSAPQIHIGPDNQEVEFTIITSGPVARAAVPDPGVEKEGQIDELDLLIFKDDKYQYHRHAFKLSGNTYKATLKVDDATLTAYVFANCREQLTTWEGQGTQEGKSWGVVQSELIDLVPAQWVSDQGEVLPMWGKTSGTVSQIEVSGWSAVSMLRSVASVDAYVEQNEKTQKFILTDAHLYYAPDRGFLAPEPDGGGYKLSSPPDMETVLNSLRAGGTALVSVDDGEGNTVTQEAIANQLYLFDNDVSASNYSPDVSPIRKYTRLILAGYYDQPDPDPDPISGEDRRIKTYYPLDFVDENAKFHDIKRNYKYVFNITSVHGEGYGSIEEAADEYPIGMNVQVIEWNRQDEYVGVHGKYYVFIERRWARLKRNAGSQDNIQLSYTVLDDIPGRNFTIEFYDDSNGTEQPIENGIENDWFKVILLQDTDSETAELKIEALRNYDPDHCEDRVIIRFREIEFIVTITQYDKDDWDWEWGGDQEEEL